MRSGALVAFAVELNIRHTYDNDLYITLTPPGGSAVVIVNRVGGSGDDFSKTKLLSGQCLQYPNAKPLVQGVSPFTGTWKPSNIINLPGSVSGNWLLTITDMSKNDVGVLNNFTLMFYDSRTFVPGVHVWS
jgi:subtilisin-like proprotein convertase family protein